MSGDQTLHRLAGLFLLCALLAGCATAISREAVPAGLADSVSVVGVGEVRNWGDGPVPNLEQRAVEMRDQVRATRPELLKTRREVTLLALSGGSSDGAFGAGLLNGWTAAGTRPEFEVVSGVSAGALLAPFAFLGPDYDRQMREVFSLYSTDDLVKKQLFSGVTGGSALLNSEPTARLIAKYVDRDFLAAVAREHARGRRLVIGTTNLDAQRPVVWDMGRIASQGTERSLELFRKVVLASTSLPGIFPPVFIEVESGGRTYKEMHVDGGTTDNTFLIPGNLDLAQLDSRRNLRWRYKAYVIVNSKTSPTPEAVEATTFGIAGRSIATLIKQQTEGDLIKIYFRARNNNIDFNLASVPPEFTEKKEELFDKAYMAKLYKLGYEAAVNGYDWQKKPPAL